MKFLATLFAIMAVVSVASANNTAELGMGVGTVVGGSPDDCTGTAFFNHDGTFENGYAFINAGVEAPYGGSFAEAYDLGAVTIGCASFWLSTLDGMQVGQTMDVYVWEGGVSGDPGAVLGMLAGVDPGPIAFWPSISQHDIPFAQAVTGEFTIGFWGAWPGEGQGWYCGADYDGFGGTPWLYAVGDGWLPPVQYSPDWTAVSMGIGGYYGGEPPTANESTTWGSIKNLF